MKQLGKKTITKSTKKILTKVKKSDGNFKLSKGKVILRDQKKGDGDIRNKYKKSRNNDKPNKVEEQAELEKKKEMKIEKKKKEILRNDFTNKKNLGDLDVESFFEKMLQEDIDDNNNEEKKEEMEIVEKDEKEDEKISKERDDDDSSSEGGTDSSEEESSTEEESNIEEVEDEEEEEEENEPQDNKGKPEISSKSKNEKDEKLNERKEEDESEPEDQEDAEANEFQDIKKAKERLKKEMQELEKTDPEFHKYLKDNEETLLEFDEDEDESDGLEDEDSSADEEMEEISIEDEEKKSVTSEIVSEKNRELIAEFQSNDNPSIARLRKIMKLYKTACSGNMQEDLDLLDDLLVIALRKCHVIFRAYLVEQNKEFKKEKNDETPEHERPLPQTKLISCQNWEKIRVPLEDFVKSTLMLLKETKQPKLQLIILKSLPPYIPFLSPFSFLAQNYLKSLVGFWSATTSYDDTQHQIRLQAYLSIRALALTQPFPFIETILKKCYLEYAKVAKFVTNYNDGSFATITLLGNCLVDLYSLETDSSYQHAFVYIRQLACLLRKAKTDMTPQAVKGVFCWQYIHCIKLWVAILSAHANELEELIYPMTELIFGIMSLEVKGGNTRYLPLKFHCIRFLQQLASSKDVYIPTYSNLLDIMEDSNKNWSQHHLKKKKVTKNQEPTLIRLAYMLKLPNSCFDENKFIPTPDFETKLLNEIISLLRHDVELYKFSPAFPEYAMPLLHHLAKSRADSRNKTFKKQALQLQNEIQKNVQYVLTFRSKMKAAPKEVTRLEFCKPQGAKSRKERYDAMIEKEKKEQGVILHPIESKEENKDSKVIQKHQESKKKKKKVKLPKPEPNLPKATEDVLEQEDTVKEGFDWSSEEE